MTEAEQDAILGRVIREHKETLGILGRLQAEMARWGEELCLLGSALKANPEGVVFNGDGLAERFMEWRHIVTRSLFDAEKLKALVNEYRRILLKREQLERQLKLMGFPRDEVR